MALARQRSRLLDIRLFGEPRFYVDGALQPIGIPPKALLLLCVLVLKTGQPVDRTKLAFTLWPDDAEDEAKGKLRRHLHLLGRAIAAGDDEPQITATNTTLTWNPYGSCRVDVVEFERLSQSPEDLEGAVAAYSGDLLPNFYDDWLEAPRRRLREQQLSNLLALAERSVQNGEPAKALEFARHALRIDPWREDAIRSVVLTRTQLGDRSGAMQEYAQFADRLREEFGAEPLTQTRQAFEAAKVTEPAKTNLPLETTSFVGRKVQVAALTEQMRTARLLTLTGPGGVGKSRTAVHCARELHGSHPDGTWLIEMGAQTDEAGLLHAIAATMCLDDLPQPADLRSLTTRLRDRQALLLLDNAEALLDSCARVCTAILNSCKEVQLLATSREPLAIAGETILRLAPFDDNAEAVELFCDRAKAADASFEQTSQNTAVISEICTRLDRLPLATELAAARVATLAPAEILERLDDRFALLKGARAPAVHHHQTMRATIDWSHDLLSPEEKTLFARLAIFTGSFTLSAVEAVCADDSLRAESMLDILSRLIDKSLVTAGTSAQTRRYRFLDSIREYAVAKLAQSRDAASLRDRYLAYYSSLATQGAKELSGSAQQSFLRLLQDELDNLRGAMQIGKLDTSQAVIALEIACELQQFWLVRGYFGEGRRWIQDALEAAGPSVQSPLRAKALSAAAILASFSDDRNAALQLEQQALALRREAGDEAGIARSVHSLGFYAFSVGDYANAQDFFNDALKRARRIQDEPLVAKALDNVGVCAVALGNLDHAQAALEESLGLYRSKDDAYGTAWVLGHLGWLAERRRDYDASFKLHAEGLQIREQLDDRHGIASSSLAIARCLDALGQHDSALAARRRSISLWHDLHSTIWLTEAFENYGYAEAASGDKHRAAVLLGAAQRLRTTTSKALPVYERDQHDDVLAQLDRAMGSEKLREDMRAGEAMTLDESVRFSLAGR